MTTASISLLDRPLFSFLSYAFVGWISSSKLEASDRSIRQNTGHHRNDFPSPGAREDGKERALGPISRKTRELFEPEKAFVKVRPTYSVKLIFSYVVKRRKTKITAKFRASERLRFEDTKRIMSPEIRPKSFGTFEKQAPGNKVARFVKCFDKGHPLQTWPLFHRDGQPGNLTLVKSFNSFSHYIPVSRDSFIALCAISLRW